MITYYGGKQPNSKEEGMVQLEKWKEWVKGIGEDVINSGTPLQGTKVITSSGVQDETDPNAMKGFAVVQAWPGAALEGMP